MTAGSLRNVGEPKFRLPEVVRIGNNPPPTTPPGMFVAPPPPDTTWLDLENREYSEFQISVDSNFFINTINANEGARFRLFVYRSNDSEITININPWQDEAIKVPGTSVSKIYVLNVECYLVPGENKLRYKVSNLIFDEEDRKDKTWSSSKIKETINAVINDEAVSLKGTWSSTKLKQAIDAKQDKIGNSLQVDEIIRKSTAETGGMNFISRSIHKDWGDRDDQYPTFKFISRVYDASGNVVFETIPFLLDGGGKLQADRLNVAYLTFNNSIVATESFVNAAIQAISNLMSTDAERIAAINELTLNYDAADAQLQQTLTTALATKAGKAVNEEISGIYNFLNGLKENGVALNALYLGINATAQNALKLGGVLASKFLRCDINGYVGIGTDSPAEALEVAGNILAKGNINLLAKANNEKLLRLSHPTAPSEAGYEIGFSDENAAISHYVEFSDSITEAFSIKRFNGNVKFFNKVGIGTDATEALDVAGTGKFTGSIEQLKIDGGNAQWKDISFSTNGSLRWLIRTTNESETGNDVGSNFALWSRADGGGAISSSVIFAERKTGYVGINTPTPSEFLDVNGNIKASGFLQAGYIRATGDNGFSCQQGNGRGLKFWDSNTYKIYMANSSDSTWGGKLDTDSDYNMYFKMGGGSRGFVFLNDKNPKVQITSGGDILAVGNIKASGNIHTDGKEIGIKNGVQLRQAAATGILENTGGGSLYLYGGSFGTASQAIKLGVSNTTYTNVVTNLKVGSNNIPEEALDVSGNIIASGTITNGSDRRLKTNIQPLTPRGELNPVTFIKNGKPDLGFIAQEVKELYPELVAGEETKDTFLTLNYSQLTAVLYAELKELRAEVKQLKQLIHNDTNV